MVSGKLGQTGILHVPLALALVVFCFAGFSMITLMHHWRSLAATQLRIDRCIANAALELKEKLTAIERANKRIEATRILLAVSTIKPEVQRALQMALKLQVFQQEAQLKAWMLKQGQWLLLRGCDHTSDLPWPLPSLPWVRDPPDILGPRPLRWIGEKREFHLQLNHSPRKAAATVSGELNEKKEWHAHWTRPRWPGLN